MALVHSPEDIVDQAVAAEHRASGVSVARTVLLVGAAMVLCGLVVGAVWAWVVPSMATVELGDGRVRLPGESANDFHATALFVFLGLAAGVVGGYGAWLVRSARGTTLLVAVVAGAAAGAWLGSLLGQWLVELRFPAVEALAVGEVAPLAPTIATWTVVLAQPFGVAVVFLVAAVLSPFDDLRGHHPLAEDPAPGED